MDQSSRYQSVLQETRLVQQAQAGSRAAFDRLVRNYRPLLLGLAYLRTSNMEVADDLVQDVLARAWQKLPGLNNPPAFAAWLKTITSHVCSNWHARVRSPIYLNEESDYESMVDTKPGPLDALLARESQQELDQALSILPTDNRLALVLYALEGSSHDEIAHLTGVPASTIDGRIRRARAQLRRLLAPDTGDPGGATASTTSLTLGRSLPRTRRKPMTQTTQQHDQSAQARALTIFTHRLATFVESGCPVARALDALGDAPAPYGDASRELSKFLQEASSKEAAPLSSAERMHIDWLYNRDMYPVLIKHITKAIEQQRDLLPSRSQGLAKALTQHPDLFSPFLTDVVYHGDNAGQLDATMRHLATLLDRQGQLAGRRPRGEEPVFPFLSASKPSAEDWKGLTAYQQHVTRVLLLRGFATMLICSVPIVRAMRRMAEVLPQAQAEIWMRACQDILNGDPIGPSLSHMEIFPGYVVPLISLGEELGTLDSTLVRAADLMEYEWGA